MTEQGERDAGESEKDGQDAEIAEGEAGDLVGRTVGVGIFVLPCVDEEAVEAAEGSE